VLRRIYPEVIEDIDQLLNPKYELYLVSAPPPEREYADFPNFPEGWKDWPGMERGRIEVWEASLLDHVERIA
jgi:hypothetical protein